MFYSARGPVLREPSTKAFIYKIKKIETNIIHIMEWKQRLTLVPTTYYS